MYLQVMAEWDQWRWVAMACVVAVPVATTYAWLASDRRTRHGRTRREALRASTLEALFGLALLAALLIMLSPGQGTTNAVRWIPLTGLADLRGAAPADAAAQIMGNLALFLAVGAILPVRWRLHLPDVMLAVATLSLAVETLQRLAIPHRTASIDDVLLNVAGAVVGAATTRRWWAVRLKPATTRRRRPPRSAVGSKARR